MIHDLLLALVGFTGDVIEADLDTRKLVLSPHVKLETFDRDIVDGILALGSLYVKIRDWVTSTLASSTGGVYELVIAKTLDEEILKEYEEDIARFEDKILDLADQGSNGGMTLSGLRLELWDRWWAVLELISVHAITISMEENCIDRIMEANSEFRCDQLMLIQQRLIDCFFRELISWCKHGVIGGANRSRFFIRETSKDIFQVDKSRIPTRLIDLELSAKVLFCGKTVLVLKNGIHSALLAEDCTVFKSNATTVKNAPEIIRSDVETLRTHLASKLGKRMKHEMNPGLVHHLKNLRGLFLMGYGEKWAAFVESLACVDPKRIPDVFQDTFEQIDSSIGCSLSETLELKYHTPRPMELVIDPPSIKKYNQVFFLIFRIFAANVKSRSCFNMQLSNLFSGLLSYLQLDLIETCFTKLVKTASESDDIELITLAHGVFLNEVYAGCLTGVTEVWTVIDSLISLNDQIVRMPGNGPSLDPKISQTVKKLIRELGILQSRTMYSSIDRLILKLDFNKFYQSH